MVGTGYVDGSVYSSLVGRGYVEGSHYPNHEIMTLDDFDGDDGDAMVMFRCRMAGRDAMGNGDEDLLMLCHH